MTTWQWVSLMILAMVHTAALFRWGGQVEEAVKGIKDIMTSHAKELTRLHDAWGRHADLISAYAVEIRVLVEELNDIKGQVRDLRGNGHGS